MDENEYVHGYSEREAMRLKDQAETLETLIHKDSVFKEGSLILEAGCGVGAQTRAIAVKNPKSKFISLDINMDSVTEARKTVDELSIDNVRWGNANIFRLPFRDSVFDGIMLCFVLEHLSAPVQALTELKRVLKPGGILMAIEGDHGSTFFYPESRFALEAINCQVKLQKENGGNSNIGRQLYPLLKTAGFERINISPRNVYVDGSKPALEEGFIKNTFTAMIEGVGEKAIEKKLMRREEFEKGITDLYRTAESDGVFSYTFFKGSAVK